MPSDLARRVVSGRPFPSGYLEALPWAHVGPVRLVAGLPMRVRTSDRDLGAHAEWILGDLPLATGEEAAPVVTYSLLGYSTEIGDAWSVCVDDRIVTGRADRAGTLQMLIWQCNQRVLREVTHDAAVLHAGCVARDGRAVLLPAPMESGKTTLVTGLLQRGFDYLTDEAATLADDASTVFGYPKPLGIDRGSWELFPRLAPPDDRRVYVDDQWHVPGSSVGTGVVVGAAQPSLVLVPTYVRGGTTGYRSTGPAAMVQALAESTFHIHDHADLALPVLARLVESTTVGHLEVADLHDACDLVIELLDAT